MNDLVYLFVIVLINIYIGVFEPIICHVEMIWTEKS